MTTHALMELAEHTALLTKVRDASKANGGVRSIDFGKESGDAFIAALTTAIEALQLRTAAAEGDAVDLERFRDAVTAWKHEGERRWTDSAGKFHITVGPNHYRAMELMDVIDKASSPTNPYAGGIEVGDANRFRQWIDSLQDVNPKYLEREDYELAERLYRRLGMRVPNSILAKLDAVIQPLIKDPMSTDYFEEPPHSPVASESGEAVYATVTGLTSEDGKHELYTITDEPFQLSDPWKLYLHPPTDSGAGRDGERLALPDSLVSMAGEAFHRENGLNWDTASMRAAIKSVWPASIVRDAERFAWLRSRCTDQLCVRVQGDNPIHKHLYGYYQLTGKALGAAIDTAIAGAAGEGNNG